MKVHYLKLYNMAHLLALYFTASKGSNNYFYFRELGRKVILLLLSLELIPPWVGLKAAELHICFHIPLLCSDVYRVKWVYNVTSFC